MADDIVLTVSVRDMTRGDFQRLDRQLDRLRRNVRDVGSASSGASQRMDGLNQSLGAVQGRMRRFQATGQMTNRELTHMRSSLSLVSRELTNAARSGEITRDQYNSLRNEVDRTRLSFDRLTQDVRLHRVQTSGAATDAQRLRMAEDRLRLAWVRSNQTAVRLTQTQQRLSDARSRAADQHALSVARLRQGDERLRIAQQRLANSMQSSGDSAGFAGGMFSNLRQKLIGTAVVLVASLLPTIGALAPMLAGIAGIVGVAALAFSGLSKPTKQLTKDEKDFLKGIRPLTKEFKGLQATARKALLPELTKSFKDVGSAMNSMNPVLKIAGKGLGELVQKSAKGIASKDFMGPFLKNVKMGTDWVLKFAGSFGKFMKAFFEFGTKSKPALDAWQDLLGGFLDRGLPSMFKSMESGISGASKYLLGLSSLINDGLLPGLGTLIGKFMEAFGPTLGDILTMGGRSFKELSDEVGSLFEALAPVGKFIGNLAVSFLDLGRIANSVFMDTAKVIGGALLESFVQVFGGGEMESFKSGMESFSTWVQNNEGPIRSAFTYIGSTIVDMVNAGVQSIPYLLQAFRDLAKVVLTTIDVMVSGLAHSFGWVPGIGDKLKTANKDFDDFSQGVISGLDTAIGKSHEFADAFGVNADKAKLTLNVEQAKAALDDIKAKLKDPDLTKERRAKLTADKEEAERKLRAAEAELAAFNRKQAKAKLDAIDNSFWGKIKAAARASIPKKSAPVTANTNPFWNAIHGLAGKVVGTSYVNVVQRAVGKVGEWLTSANGNVFRSFANGGENHEAQIADGGPIRMWAEPETGGEAYIPLGPAKRSRSRRVAESAVGVLGGSIQWFAKGGLSDSAKSARKDLASSFGISSFGRMAGYSRTPFERSLAVPGDISGLVSGLNQAASLIRKAFSGKTESSLIRSLTNTGKALIKNQKNLDKVNKSLETAKTKLDDLRQSASQMKESVTSGVLSATDITSVASGDKNVTMQDVMAQMRTGVDKSTAFAGALSQLKSKGVSKQIIQQISEAGISGGGLETAGAILTASSSEIKTLNDMQAKIGSAATSAGKTASDAMYAAGIKAADGLVKGLQKKQDAIEAQMLKIAKSMEKAIKKALGIKSPSKVMEKVGDFTAEGFAVGMRNNSNVPAAWSSMLNTGPGTSAGSSGTGAGAQVIQLCLDGRVLDEIILDSNRRTVRTRGGNVQAVYGRRNG